MSSRFFPPRVTGSRHRLFTGRVARRTFPTMWLGASVVLAGLVGCAHGSSIASEPNPAQQPTGGYGERLSTHMEETQSSSGKAANERGVGRTEELLEGRFPGVDLVRTITGGFLVRIRGVSSFLGRSEPLYVIDGTPTEVQPQRGLDWLNPGDIRRITVLKGPPETSLYGVRGANGVIVIETRTR